MEAIKNSSSSSMKDRMRYSVLMCMYMHEDMGVRFYQQLRRQHSIMDLPDTLSGFIPVQWLFNRLSWNATVQGRDYWMAKAHGIHGWDRFKVTIRHTDRVVYEGTHHELDFF